MDEIKSDAQPIPQDAARYPFMTEEDGMMMFAASELSSDIAELLTDIQQLEGAAFILQLKLIASHRMFHPLEGETDIFYTGGEDNDDFNNLLNAARKAVDHGFKVYILPNPKGIRTADFIFERRGVYRMYDLKTIQGRASVGNRLLESIDQSNRVLLNMCSFYNTRLLVADIKQYFEVNNYALEVLIFKGHKEISITRRLAKNPSLFSVFKKLYEK